MTYQEYSDYMANRASIISKNRSNRLRGLPLLIVPVKIEPPKVLVAYEPDGTYAGVINDLSELPDGYSYKYENAVR